VIATCQRCGKICQGGVGNPEARLLKRASSGLCVNCVITQFLKTTEPLSIVLNQVGVKAFYNPDVQAQISQLLKVGHSDASLYEIDWQVVIKNWDLPFKK
jgi:hypothetical protein